MPPVTTNNTNSCQNTSAAPLYRDPIGAERPHWDCAPPVANSFFVLQIRIISDRNRELG